MIKTVLSAMNGGFLQTLKLFAVTLAGALPLGLLLSFCSMSRFKPLKWLTRTLVWIVRGTPLMLQLLILYFIIFATVNIDKTLVAILAFGLNSAAYVAEIVRSGIMSIDNGQFEAGASLGLNYSKTMLFIILPQAFKNILPALANECIVLLKETSVAGYIALVDLTKGGDIIRSQTYEAFLPLIAVAIIYLVMVMFLSAMVSKLERRLAKSDRG